MNEDPKRDVEQAMAKVWEQKLGAANDRANQLAQTLVTVRKVAEHELPVDAPVTHPDALRIIAVIKTERTKTVAFRLKATQVLAEARGLPEHEVHDELRREAAEIAREHGPRN